MIVFGVIAMLLQIGTAAMCIYKYFRPRINLRFLFIFLGTSAALYLLGFIVYLSIIDPNSIDKPKDRDLPYNNPSDVKARIGIIMAAITTLVLIGQALIGTFLFLRYMR